MRVIGSVLVSSAWLSVDGAEAAGAEDEDGNDDDDEVDEALILQTEWAQKREHRK